MLNTKVLFPIAHEAARQTRVQDAVEVLVRGLAAMPEVDVASLWLYSPHLQMPCLAASHGVGSGRRTIIEHPMVFQQELLGVLGIRSSQELSEHHSLMLEHFAELAAIALTSARWTEGIAAAQAVGEFLPQLDSDSSISRTRHPDSRDKAPRARAA